MRIATERLLLRDFSEADLERQPPPAAVEKDQHSPFDLSNRVSLRQQIRAALDAARESPRRTWELAVTLRDGDQLIGRGGIRQSPDEPRNAQVWFVSDPGTWNKGYVTEAAEALFAFGFEELKLHRLWSETDPSNGGAARVMEKLGMRREAHFVENAWIDGQWRDTAVYALLDREWRARRRG